MDEALHALGLGSLDHVERAQHIAAFELRGIVDHARDMDHRFGPAHQLAQRVGGIEIAADPFHAIAWRLRAPRQSLHGQASFQCPVEQRLSDKAGGAGHGDGHSSTI